MRGFCKFMMVTEDKMSKNFIDRKYTETSENFV